MKIETDEPLRVRLLIGTKGKYYSNILWNRKFRRCVGDWPRMSKSHPCHNNPKPTVFKDDEIPITDDPLGRFRQRGYFASCFPEGDGIAFEIPDDKTIAEIVKDIKDCFGFEVDYEV